MTAAERDERRRAREAREAAAIAKKERVKRDLMRAETGRHQSRQAKRKEEIAQRAEARLEAQIQRVFDMFDIDGHGTIDMGELRAMTIALGEPQVPDAEIQFVMATFDTNRDGKFKVYFKRIETKERHRERERERKTIEKWCSLRHIKPYFFIYTALIPRAFPFQ